MIDILNEWAAFLYAPLMEDRPRLIEETSSGHYGREVASSVHQRLREAGGVTPPREFVLHGPRRDRPGLRCSCTSRPR